MPETERSKYDSYRESKKMLQRNNMSANKSEED